MKTLETSYSKISTGLLLQLDILFRGRVTGSEWIPVDEIIRTGIRVWEIESLHLERIQTHRLNPRVIGNQYYLKSDVKDHLIMEWVGVETLE